MTSPFRMSAEPDKNRVCPEIGFMRNDTSARIEPWSAVVRIHAPKRLLPRMKKLIGMTSKSSRLMGLSMGYLKSRIKEKNDNSEVPIRSCGILSMCSRAMTDSRMPITTARTSMARPNSKASRN